MQDTKKKLTIEDSKKKERHIVSWTQQVSISFPRSLFHFLILVEILLAVVSDMGSWSFRRMIFSESRLINMEQRSMNSLSFSH